MDESKEELYKPNISTLQEDSIIDFAEKAAENSKIPNPTPPNVQTMVLSDDYSQPSVVKI